jgi:hypothetical protein
VCMSSAGRRAVRRFAVASLKYSAIITQTLIRQCLIRLSYVRTCAADTLKRYCVTKRLVAAKRSLLLMSAAAFKILLARRRAQFYRRWYNRLVGRSVRVMQYACRSAKSDFSHSILLPRAICNCACCTLSLRQPASRCGFAVIVSIPQAVRCQICHPAHENPGKCGINISFDSRSRAHFVDQTCCRCLHDC